MTTTATSNNLQMFDRSNFVGLNEETIKEIIKRYNLFPDAISAIKSLIPYTEDLAARADKNDEDEESDNAWQTILEANEVINRSVI